MEAIRLAGCSHECRVFGAAVKPAPSHASHDAAALRAAGQDSRAQLAARVGTTSLTCQHTDVDRYGRVVAICRLVVAGATIDVNDWMVRQGWAVAYRCAALCWGRAAGRQQLQQADVHSGGGRLS